MSERIKPENLSDEIQLALKNYYDDITDEVRETADSVAKEAKATVTARSPVASHVVKLKNGGSQAPGSYKHGWRISRRSGSDYIDIKIHNQYYQLTHLLEFGHHIKGTAKMTKKIPHIRNTEKEYIEKFRDELTKKLQKGD